MAINYGVVKRVVMPVLQKPYSNRRKKFSQTKRIWPHQADWEATFLWFKNWLVSFTCNIGDSHDENVTGNCNGVRFIGRYLLRESTTGQGKPGKQSQSQTRRSHLKAAESLPLRPLPLSAHRCLDLLGCNIAGVLQGFGAEMGIPLGHHWR